MALHDADIQNFRTLKRASDNGDLAIVQTTDLAGNYVALVCALDHSLEDGQVGIVPLARMIEGDPYAKFVPPIEPDPDEAPDED